MNRRLLELLDDLVRFGERADAGGSSEEGNCRRALARLFWLRAWFESEEEVDWQQFLVCVLVGYAEAWERLLASDIDVDKPTPGVERSLREVIVVLDNAAEAMEREIDVTTRNRIAAEAVCRCHDWHTTDAVVAFVYWQTGEMLTKSNANTLKSRMLKEMKRYLEAQHD